MLAALLFVIVITLVIWQPKGLQIGTTAVIGALVAYVLGIVSLQDVITVTDIVWDATLAFIGIVLLSMALDEIGFFEWAAIKMARLSKGSGYWLFFNILILGAIVAALFANDGAALILTPILLAKMKHLKMSPVAIFAFLMAGGFIGDTASNPLVISNLTNIVSADYFNIGFWEYAQHMFLPNLVAIIASIIVLFLFFRKQIPARVDITHLPEARSVIKNPALFKFSWFFLALLLVGYFVGDIYHLPISIFALGGALLFIIIAAPTGAIQPKVIFKTAPWQVVWFSIGLYVVVFGLKNAGLTEMVGTFIASFSVYGSQVLTLATGLTSAVLSAIMNNMPTIMIMDLAVDHIQRPDLVYANIIGANLGPKITPIGSLATLLWLHVLAQKGVTITWGQYMKVGIIITPPVLIASLLAL